MEIDQNQGINFGELPCTIPELAFAPCCFFQILFHLSLLIQKVDNTLKLLCIFDNQ